MAVIMRTHVVIGGFQGGPGIFTFYFLPPSPASVFVTADASAALARVRSFVVAIRPHMAQGVTYDMAGQCDVLNPANGDLVTSLVGDIGAAIPVSDSGTFAPPSNAALVTWLTSGIVHGRALKGNMFISPLSAASIAGGVLNGAAPSQILTAATEFIGQPQSGPALAVWSRPVKIATLRVPVRDGDAFAVQSASVATKLAVLTSRRD